MIDPSDLNLSALEQQHGLPNGLLSAVMQTESGGNPDAFSPVGAQGLFQFMPATAKQYGIDPTDPTQSAQGAARMYGDLSKKYNGDLPSMLAAYNWGQGNVDRQGLDNAPQETQDYIKRVTGRLPVSPEMIAEQPLPKESGGRPNLDEIFGGKDASAARPSLDDIFGGSDAVSAKAAPRPDPGMFNTVSDNAVQGATFGLGNRAEAGLAALVLSAMNDKGFSKNYEDARNVESQQLRDEMQQHPLAAFASNIGGAVASGGLIGKTAAGAALGNSVRSGSLLARSAKGALAGAASGAAYGAGSADYGKTAEGAKQGALSGALVGGAIPGVGAALSDVGKTAANVVKGAFARTPEAVQDAANALKSNAGALYDKMRQAGATFTPQASQKLITDLKSTLSSQSFLPSLNPKTIGVVNDLDNIIAQAGSGGNLELGTLDQIRRQLGRIGPTEDGVSAGKVRSVIDDFVNNATGKDLSSGSRDAIDFLNQGRQQYAQASKFEKISDILTSAGGDPNKIKAGLTRFLNSSGGKPRGYTAVEVKALKDAASSTGSEKLLKMAGKFGIDLGTSLTPGNTVAPVIGALASGGGTVPIAGTVARQAQKYAARSKAENLLKLINTGGKPNTSVAAPISPLLSILGAQQAAIGNSQYVPVPVGLKRMAVKP